MHDPQTDAPASFGLAFGTVLAVLAMVAAAVGWRAAWVVGQEHLRAPLDLSANDIDVYATELKRQDADEDAREAVRRLREHEAVRGVDVLALLVWQHDAGHLRGSGPTEAKAWNAALWAARALLWAPIVLGVLVLLHGSRPLGRLARGLLIAHGVVIGAAVALLVLGMSQSARDTFTAHPGLVGWGLWALVGGSALGLLVGLFGGHRGGIFGALGVAILLLLLAGGGVVAYLKM